MSDSGSDRPLLQVDDLAVHFHSDAGVVKAVDGLSFEVARGEVLGIVGESGSGKSVTNLALLGLIPTPPGRIASGKAVFDGEDLLAASAERIRQVRGNHIAMIFQDPMTALNPYLTVERQLTEILELHKRMPRAEARERAIEMLERVGIPEAARRIDDHPHQFSGGMRQRVMIAMALLCEPELLIADEPTTALDVTIQAQILDIIRDLQRDEGTSVILITHDLGVVAGLADRVAVMYAGRIIEQGTTEEVFLSPSHPYTRGLLRSAPRIDSADDIELSPIPGLPPDLGNLPPGCPFHPRCAEATDRCRQDYPRTVELGLGRFAKCWHTEAP